MKDRIILITGPKHSGKSLCARMLGKIIGCETIDLDGLIEKQTGASPRALYNRGPEIFQAAEARALASLFRNPPPSSATRVWSDEVPLRRKGCFIIASGGGLCDNREALALLSESSGLSGDREIISVYLDVSAETAWRRIPAGAELPPFLDTENPRETHFALHERRAKAYKAMAQITVSGENKSPEEIAGEIAGLLR